METRVVVIGDTEEMLMLYQDILQDEGYEVVASSYPYADLQQIDDLQPHLIILDYLFDGEPKGWSMIQALKQRSSTARIPVIFATVATQMIEAMTPELDQYNVRLIQKPFNIDQLLDAVHAQLSDA